MSMYDLFMDMALRVDRPVITAVRLGTAWDCRARLSTPAQHRHSVEASYRPTADR